MWSTASQRPPARRVPTLRAHRTLILRPLPDSGPDRGAVWTLGYRRPQLQRRMASGRMIQATVKFSRVITEKDAVLVVAAIQTRYSH